MSALSCRALSREIEDASDSAKRKCSYIFYDIYIMNAFSTRANIKIIRIKTSASKYQVAIDFVKSRLFRFNFILPVEVYFF